MQYFLSAQTAALRFSIQTALEKRLQRLPITPDKDHLVVSDVLSEIKQWGKVNMMKGFFSSL